MKMSKDRHTTLGIRVDVNAILDLFYDLVMTMNNGYPDKEALISVYPFGEFGDWTKFVIVSKSREYIEYLSDGFDNMGLEKKRMGRCVDDEDGEYIYNLEVPMAGFVEVFLNGFNKFWRGGKNLSDAPTSLRS